MPTANIVRRVATAPWRGVPATGAAEEKPDRRRASDAESRAHADLDSAEIRGVTGYGLQEGSDWRCRKLLAEVLAFSYVFGLT